MKLFQNIIYVVMEAKLARQSSVGTVPYICSLSHHQKNTILAAYVLYCKYIAFITSRHALLDNMHTCMIVQRIKKVEISRLSNGNGLRQPNGSCSTPTHQERHNKLKMVKRTEYNAIRCHQLSCVPKQCYGELARSIVSRIGISTTLRFQFHSKNPY